MTIQRELYARSAGRCQFPGCNKIVYMSDDTQDLVNVGEKAHIYGYSKNGPRYNSDIDVNRISNLMLICGHHHSVIDDKILLETKYTDEWLQKHKRQHEDHIRHVTGFAPSAKTNVITYNSKIDGCYNLAALDTVYDTIFYQKCRFPSTVNPYKFLLTRDMSESDEDMWDNESRELEIKFKKNIAPLLEEENQHFSIFAIAPQPLLIKLGSLFRNIHDMDLYQLHRNPQSWAWPSSNANSIVEFITNRPDDISKKQVLLLSLSDRVDHDRIKEVLGDDVSIWEFTIDNPSSSFLTSESLLQKYSESISDFLNTIGRKSMEPLHIFPIMPVACNVELGRVRFPNADRPWILYNNHIDPATGEKRFHKTITIV